MMAIAKNYLKIIGLFTLLVAVAGCGRIQTGQPADPADVSVEFAVQPAEPAVGPAQLVITVTGRDGQPIDDATLEIEGNMTHAGMVPVFAQATGGENGRYVVPFEWSMGGDWNVTVEVTLQDGQVISRQFPVLVK